MDLQTWIIAAIIATIGVSIFLFLFRSLGFLIKAAVVIAVLVFLFGWAAVANIPNRIWEGIQSLGNTQIDVKINNEPAKCVVIPNKNDAQRLLDATRPAINTLLGSLASDVTISIVDNKECKDKASIEIRSSSVDAVNRIKTDIEKLLPNIPVDVIPR